MLAESTSQSGDRECAGDALAEIQACTGGLETFVLDAFDQLGKLTDELLTRALANQQAQREVLQDQINRLVSVVGELSEAVAEQKRLAGEKRPNG